MKRIVKTMLKAIWRLTSPIRRPLVTRLDAHISAVVSGTVNARILPEILRPMAIALARLERIEASIASADRTASVVAEEIDLVLNGVSREVYRLQVQVETLQRLVGREIREAHNGLSLVDESEDEAPARRTPTPERSRVG